jgi:hypothetical protein
MRPSKFLLAMLASAACATANPSPSPSADRVLVVDSDGTPIHQSTSDQSARAFFAAPVAKVWPAVMLSYSDLGIQPSISDRAAGRYGSEGFVAPRHMMGRPLGDYFRCGYGMTGPVIDAGRLYGSVVSTITDDGKGGSVVFTYVTGSLRRNDGSSSDPINCGSTGAIEEYIRTATTKHIQGS